MQDINITSNGTHTLIYCKYYPYSDPYGCQITYGCSAVITDSYSKNFSFLMNDDNNFTNSSVTKVFYCQSCSQYDLMAYDLSSDGKRIETPSVEKKNVTLCPDFPGMFTVYPFRYPCHQCTFDILWKIIQLQ